MGQLERFLLLQIIDERWREHLFDVDSLREGIHLRGFVQIDPLVAYKNEAFTLFGDLINSIWADYTRLIFNVQVQVQGENGGAGAAPVPAFAAAGNSRDPRGCPTRVAAPRWEPERSPPRPPTPALPVRRHMRPTGAAKSRSSRRWWSSARWTPSTQSGARPCWCG